jgi:hypothetical protein
MVELAFQKSGARIEKSEFNGVEISAQENEKSACLYSGFWILT